MTLDIVIDVIARELDSEKNSFTMDTRLADFGVDSMKVVTIIFELEEAFNIQVPNEELANIKTVGDIVTKIDGILAHRGA